MKNALIKLFHFVLGYERYLLLFSRFKIAFLKFDGRKQDYLFFEKSIGDSACVLVIGANIGITTIPFAKGKPNRKIFAYEPVQSNYTVLKRNINDFALHNIKAYEIALGREKGNKEIILPIIGGAKKHGMAHINTSSISLASRGEKQTIEMDILDDRDELQNIKIDAIKLVAENYETKIIEGAESLIKAHKPFIYCELWNNEQRVHAMKLIKEYGYQIYYREQEGLKKYDNSDYTGKKFFFKPI